MSDYETTLKARWAAEEARAASQTARLLEVANEGQRLGYWAGFELHHTDTDRVPGWLTITDTEGRRFSLNVDRQSGRLEGRVASYRCRDGHHVGTSDVVRSGASAPGMSAALDKPLDALVRDIKRRLFDAGAEVADKVREVYRKREAQHDARDALADKLRAQGFEVRTEGGYKGHAWGHGLRLEFNGGGGIYTDRLTVPLDKLPGLVALLGEAQT